MQASVPPKDRYRMRVGDAALERVTAEHAAPLWNVVERERAHLDTHQPAAETSFGEMQATIERAVRAWEAGYQYRFVISQRGELVGMCGFVDVFEESGVGELGFWLTEAAAGQGLATESVRTLTTVAFRDLGLQRIEVETAMGNVRARRVMERLGFKLEGVRRSCERVASGELVDHALYGMLIGEWRP